MNTNSKIEVDTTTGLLCLGGSGGSSPNPTFNSLTVTNNASVGGNLTVSGGTLTSGGNSGATLALSGNGSSGFRVDMFSGASGSASNTTYYNTTAAGAGNASYGRIGLLSNTSNRDLVIDTGSNGTGTAGNIAINPGGGILSTSGNLTVSGTGETSTLGYLRVGTNTGGSTSQGTFNFGQLADDRCFRGGYRSGTLNRFEIQGTNGNGSAFATLGIEGTTLVVNAVTGGNVLIGTTADGGQKLQVNGTGYFAGALLQLGDGTADAIYRVSASNGKSTDLGDDTTGGFLRANNSQSLRFITGGTTALTLDPSSQDATFAGFILNRTNNKGVYTGTSDNCGFTWTGTNGEFSTASGSLILKSAGTTALTLDSSQNATFAGGINVSGSGQSSFAGSINATIATAGATQSLLIRNTDNTNSASNALMQATVGGASAGDPYILLTVDSVQDWNIGVDNSDADKFKIGRSSSVGTNTVLTLDTSGNATVSGSIAIGNTVAAAAGVASTHKVTISIGGSTYYLLATNV